KRLSQLFRGELDWIVMKCLEKDRSRRYETANALALDLRRYLHDEPVQACPPSAGYRFRKFARRNKTALAAVAALGAAALRSGLFGIYQSPAAADLRQAPDENDRQQRRTRATLAIMALERGQSLCELEDVGQGLLWLARGLEHATEAEDADLQRVLRWNLASCHRRLHPWRMTFPHGAWVWA